MTDNEEPLGTREGRVRLLEALVQLLSEQTDTTRLVESIYGIGMQDFGADRISVLLYDPASGGLVSDLQFGIERVGINRPLPASGAKQSDPQPLASSISGKCFVENKAVIENDCSTTTLIPRKFVDQLGLKSTLAVPIPGDSGPIGVMRIDDLTRYGRFGERDVDFFTLVAKIVGSVLRKQRMNKEIEEASARLQRLNSELEARVEDRTQDLEKSRRDWESLAAMAARLVEADTAPALARIIRATTLELFDWDAFIFSQRVPDTDDFLRVLSCDTFEGARIDIDNAADPPKPYKTRSELHRGEALLIHNSEQSSSEMNRFGNDSRLSACLLYAPVSIGGSLFGILSVQSYTPAKWSAPDLALLQSIGGLAAPALRRILAERELLSRLHELEEANAEIRRTTKLKEALYHLAESIRKAETLDELFPLLHAAIGEVLPAENFFIALYEPKGDLISFSFAIDEVATYSPFPIPMEKTLTGMVIRSKEPLLVDEVVYEKLVESGALHSFGHPPKSWLGFPLVIRGRVVGAMVVQSYSDPNAFGPDALAIMSFVSTEVASAIAFKQEEEARRVREERYRKAITQADAVPYERDLRTGEWVHLGEGIVAVTGYTHEEFTPNVWRNILLRQEMCGELAGMRPEDAYQQMKAGKLRAWKAEYLIRTRDGQERWLADSSIPLNDTEGKPLGSLGLLQDITESKRAAHLNEALSKLGARLSAARTPREVGQVAADVLADVLGWDTFFLDLHDAEKDLASSILSIDTSDGVRSEYASIYAKPRQPTPTFRRVLQGGALLISNTDDAATLAQLSTSGTTSRRSASRIFVPVRHRGNQTIGVMSVQSYTEGFYSDRNIPVVQAVADHCGAALDRTHAEVRLHAAEARMATFGTLAHRLSFVTTPRQAGELIAEAAEELLGWDACFFDLYDSRTNIVHNMVNKDLVGGTKKSVPGNHNLGPPTVSEQRMLATGAFMIERDAVSAPPMPLSSFGDESRPSACLLYAPARKGEEIVAFLSVQSYTPHAYTAESLELLQSLADHCAGALERIRLEEGMRKSEERYALAARGANDGLWDWDLVSDRVYFSSRWKAMLGYDDAAVGEQINEWFLRVAPEDLPALKEKLDDHLAGKTDHLQQEHRILHRDGKVRWVLCRGVAVRDASGTPLRVAGSLTDITQQKMAEAQLVRSAFYDPLTGLANRALFMDRLAQALQRSRRNPNHHFAVMFFDLDRFKLVNDTLGHPVGDKLLKEIAVRLQKYFRAADTVARLGGDEFTIILDDIKGVRDVVMVAERVLKDFTVPFVIDEHEIYASASIGIATNEIRYEKVDDILRDADTALYRAKEAGKGRFEVFDETMRDSVLAIIDTETALRNALARNEFVLYYQPIFELETTRVAGFEALIRWNHPVKGLQGPGAFIPIAEESGQIIPIGEWVLREACRQIGAWRRQYEKAKPCYVSVNVSARQFSSTALTAVIEEELARNELPGSSLHLELTETALQRDPTRINGILHHWKQLGVHIMLDDFGTGYSSLTHLNCYPVDCLKIDRSFVNGLSNSAESQHIVRAVISLAGILRMKVIAEGAETESQVNMLRELHCDFVQGYYLSKPRPASEIEQFLR